MVGMHSRWSEDLDRHNDEMSHDGLHRSVFRIGV